MEYSLRIEQVLGHKTNLKKYKKKEMISSTFSDHNVMKLEINCRKKKMEKYEHMETKQHAI